MPTVEADDRPKLSELDGLRVLVVDDEPGARVSISTILENHGATTLEATDGDEALRVCRRERPDLVTLDLAGPGKNGIEVFHEMRQDSELREIPVCIVTGRPEMRQLIYERSFGPPPDGYVDKPFAEATLLLRVRKIVALRNKRLARVR